MLDTEILSRTQEKCCGRGKKGAVDMECMKKEVCCKPKVLVSKGKTPGEQTLGKLGVSACWCPSMEWKAGVWVGLR